MEQKTSEYETQAEEFLQKTGTIFSAIFLKHDKHFDDDKEKRDIYEITLTRGDRVFKFNFGQSIGASGEYIVKDPCTVEGFVHGQKLSKEEKKKFQWQAQKKQHWYQKAVENNLHFKAPTAYDVLACLQKNDVGNFEDFCSEFGYDTDSRKAEKVYNAVLNEFNNVKMIYNDAELEMMREIQ